MVFLNICRVIVRKKRAIAFQQIYKRPWPGSEHDIEEFNRRNAVATDGISMDILPFVALAISENNLAVTTHLSLNISIINNTLTPFRFSLEGIWMPELVAPDGQVLHR